MQLFELQSCSSRRAQHNNEHNTHTDRQTHTHTQDLSLATASIIEACTFRVRVRRASCCPVSVCCSACLNSLGPSLGHVRTVVLTTFWPDLFVNDPFKRSPNVPHLTPFLRLWHSYSVCQCQCPGCTSASANVQVQIHIQIHRWTIFAPLCVGPCCVILSSWALGRCSSSIGP